jgi:hypothetical protein
MRPLLALFAAAALALPAFAGNTAGVSPSTNNDDSCDIAVMPAATLLLPYFECDFTAPSNVAKTTLLTIRNASASPQIAKVVLWTDFGYPILDFDLFLTGYDVQAINLYDVISRGFVARLSGTSSDTGPGQRSLPNGGDPRLSIAKCAQLPGRIPDEILRQVRSALTVGKATSCGSARIGGTHQNAIGYATVDVVAMCGPALPSDAKYFDRILFDNVLTGDYLVVDPNTATGNYAGGNPLVHIRAVPEGGLAGTTLPTNLPYTFYDRFTTNAPTRTFDRRQPLPSTFNARYIEGGTGDFRTTLNIWREGVTSGSCADASKNDVPFTEIVRFDEHENPRVYGGGLVICCISFVPTLPASSRISTTSSLFPYMDSPAGDVAGWMYLNLNNGGSNAYSVTTAGVSQTTPPTGRNFRTPSVTSGVRQSQNWVTVSMYAEGRYGVEFDATALGNGCSPAPTVGMPIGPSPNATP